MLKVESLNIKPSVIEHDYAGSEVGDFFTVQYALLLEFLSITSRECLRPADYVLHRSFRVAATNPINPFKLAANLLWLLQVVLVQGFAIESVGDNRLKGGVKPTSEVRGTLVIDKLGCIFRDECLQVFLRWESIVLVIVMLLKYDKLALLQWLLSDELRALHAEDLEEICDFFTVRCPPICRAIRAMFKSYLKI